MKRDNILVIVGIVSLIIVSTFLFRHRIEVHHADDPIAKTIIDLQGPVAISRINVLSGDEFDLTLMDSTRIHAILDVKTTPEAKPKVRDFIAKCSNPKVVLRKKHNDIWLVDIYLTTSDVAGQKIEINLSKWIEQKKLAYGF